MVRRCEQCHFEEAAVSVQSGERTLHLCPGCAAAIGGQAGASQLPLFEGLSDHGPCPGCGATVASVRASGRLGCAECWEHYGAMLRSMTVRLHGSDRHLGRGYLDPAVDGQAGDLAAMESVLRAAIAAEAFEEAAAIRDAIRASRGSDGR